MRVFERFKYFKILLNLFFFANFYEDEPGKGGSSSEPKPIYSGEMVEIKDPKSGNMIKVPVELKDTINSYMGHVISTTRDKVKEEYAPVLQNLEKDSADLVQAQAELEKLKEANMTAEERAQEQARKLIKEHEKTAALAKDESAKWKSRFEKSTIRTDIFNAFGDVKLFNPGQVALLFQSEGKARLSEKIDSDGKPTDEFEAIVTLMLEDKDGKPEEVEGTPSELFKRWIDLERNFYLRQADIKSGGGTPPSGKGNFGKINWGDLSPSERITKAREQGVGSK